MSNEFPVDGDYVSCAGCAAMSKGISAAQAENAKLQAVVEAAKEAQRVVREPFAETVDVVGDNVQDWLRRWATMTGESRHVRLVSAWILIDDALAALEEKP